MKWVVRALRNELIDFWRRYPLGLVMAEGSPKSLHYYVYDDGLSWDSLELDGKGIPVYMGRLFGHTYNPAFIAWYGLARLQDYLRGTNADGKTVFLNQVQWLKTNYHKAPDGMIVWFHLFDWNEGPILLKSPWPSAIAQGQAISALVRGFRITGDMELLEICRGAAKAFRRSIAEGGIRTFADSHVFHAEYPAHPVPRILDGFLSGLLGLYDLHKETNDPEVLESLTEGIDGLKHLLPYWTYRNKWSWYGSRTYLCSRQYHTLNFTLLAALARVCDDPVLNVYVERWDPAKLSVLSRCEIYFAFLFTKNVYRARHQTWRQKAAVSISSLTPDPV